MPVRLPVFEALETEHLILRPSTVDEAAIYRQLWTERDPRVPPHRRIDSKGRPSVEDIAAQIRAEREESGPRLLAVERKSMGDVIGYCGLILHGYGSPDELSCPTSCCARLTAAGLRLKQVELSFHGRARRATGGCGPESGTGMPHRGVSWRSSGSGKRAEWSPTLSTATACSLYVTFEKCREGHSHRHAALFSQDGPLMQAVRAALEASDQLGLQLRQVPPARAQGAVAGRPAQAAACGRRPGGKSCNCWRAWRCRPARSLSWSGSPGPQSPTTSS